MPLRKVKGGWTFGGATYPNRAVAERAHKAYLARKNSKGR